MCGTNPLRHERVMVVLRREWYSRKRVAELRRGGRWVNKCDAIQVCTTRILYWYRLNYLEEVL